MVSSNCDTKLQQAHCIVSFTYPTALPVPAGVAVSVHNRHRALDMKGCGAKQYTAYNTFQYTCLHGFSLLTYMPGGSSVSLLQLVIIALLLTYRAATVSNKRHLCQPATWCTY